MALLPRFRRFAIALTGRAQEADDLVQAACERALRSSDRFEEGTRLDAWMFTIIRNLWIDEMRRRKTSGPHEPIDGAEDLVGEDGRSRTLARLDLADVRRGIAALPAEQREVLTLVCIEDMSYRDTASLLGIPIGTVMSRLARARRALGEALGLGEDDPVVAGQGG